MTSSTFLLHPPFALPSAPAERSVHDAATGRAHADVAEGTHGWAPVPFVPPEARLDRVGEPLQVIDALAPGLHPTPVSSVTIGEEVGAAGRTGAIAPDDGELPSISDYLIEGAWPEAGADAPRWPIAEVGSEVARLSDGLPTARGAAAPSARDAEAATSDAEALAPWSDDDAWLDIMPAASPAVTRELEAQVAWARAFAEPPAPMTPVPTVPATTIAPPAPGVTGDADIAARALEEVARRLRAGELALPAWSPTGGDAAALAATLTALLGERR